jgi:acetolactate synthase-1/2/3 large subunit
VFLDDPNRVLYELEKAIDIALSPRMGPVWIDIPSDIQVAVPNNLFKYTKKIVSNYVPAHRLITDAIQESSRPLILAGNGIHLSNTRKEFRNFIERNNIPFVSTYLGRDIVEESHSLNIGAIGIKGSRAGNFAMQNCDLLLIMGCSLNATHMGYDEAQFSPLSKKIMIDIDENEYLKSSVYIDKLIKTDLAIFFSECSAISKAQDNFRDWMANETYTA